MTISPDFQLEGFERFNYITGVRLIRHRKAALPDEIFVYRTSANRYQIYACSNTRMAEPGTVRSIEELEHFCKEFFGL